MRPIQASMAEDHGWTLGSTVLMIFADGTTEDYTVEAIYDLDNLWVVDGSCFPTSGGYNPTLTILANAYRVADHFIAEAKRQNL